MGAIYAGGATLSRQTSPGEVEVQLFLGAIVSNKSTTGQMVDRCGDKAYLKKLTSI